MLKAYPLHLAVPATGTRRARRAPYRLGRRPGADRLVGRGAAEADVSAAEAAAVGLPGVDLLNAPGSGDSYPESLPIYGEGAEVVPLEMGPATGDESGAITDALDRISVAVSSVGEAVSSVTTTVGDAVSNVTATVVAVAPPPLDDKHFSAQEVVLIPAFLLLLRPTLRAGHLLATKMRSRTADQSPPAFEDSIFAFLERPLQLLAIPISVDFVLDNAVNYIAALPASTSATMETLDTAGRRFESLAYLIWSVSIANQLKTRYLDSVLEGSAMGRNLAPTLSKGFDVALIFYFSASTLQVFGLNAQALGLAGVTSLLIALPAQTLLQQFLASLILTSPGRNFTKGDYVSIGDARGTVQDVGWYRTELITDDSHPIYVPNDMCIKNTNTNYTRGAYRRWLEEFSIIGGDLAAFHSVVDAMRAEFGASGVCDPDMPLRIHINGFEDCGVSVRVEVYILKVGEDDFGGYMEGKHELMGIALRILATYNCRLASQAAARLLTADGFRSSPAVPRLDPSSK